MEIIDFSCNVNPLGLPKGLFEKIDLEKVVSSYPDHTNRGAIESFSSRYSLPQENLAVGGGSTEFFFTIPDAFNIGTGIVIAPTFWEYETSLKYADKKVRHFRKAGLFVFGEVDAKVKRFVNVTRAHDIAEQIEGEVKEKIKEVASFTVHVEPFKPAKQKLVVPIKKDKGLDSELMENFGRANYLMFVTIKNNKILGHYVKRNLYKKSQMGAGLKTVHYILEESPSALVTKQIGAITFHTLRGNLVDIYETRGATAKEVVHLFLEKKLKRLKKPTKEKI